MKVYAVAYVEDGRIVDYGIYKPGTTIKDIVKELTYESNRYGKDWDEIAIFDVNVGEPAVYCEVVTKDGKYELVEEV